MGQRAVLNSQRCNLISIKVSEVRQEYWIAMHTDLIERYGGAVPRYTSYPTAPQFHDGIGADQYAAWLHTLPDRETISLYLHVPFCARMCWYCGCHTKIVNRPEPIHAYAETLIREIALTAAATQSPRVSHVHWGGGTPTILSPADFEAVMSEIRHHFEIQDSAELAVEIDPRTLTPEMSESLARSGVNRVSLGIQDFDPVVQKAINRVQTFRQTRAVAERLRELGIQGLNLDLMYGLPHQGLAAVLSTIDQAVALKPDRISLFGYAHVPWMKSHQKMIDEAALPAGVERWQHAEAAAERLSAHGFRRIGFDHFARPGDPLTVALEAGRLRRNFQGYTDDEAQTLLGFGASSIGSLPQGYVQNSPSIRQWRRDVEDGKFPIVKGCELAPEDDLRRNLISRLICDMGVDLTTYQSRHGAPSDGFADELRRLQPLADDGLVSLDGPRIQVTDNGRPFVRNVCAVFDTYLENGNGRHSRAV